ncbi:MAG: zinc-ribbon domain-containing protein [Acutalibacteraceae bacterium]
MFCKNCGCEIDENSKFCNNCGSKTGLGDGKREDPGSDVKRDVVISHLENVRALEIAKYKLNEKMQELEKKIHSLGVAHFFEPAEKPGVVTYMMIFLACTIIAAILICVLQENSSNDEGEALIPLLILSTIVSAVIAVMFSRRDKKRVDKENKRLKEKEDNRLYDENTQKINLSNKLNDLKQEEKKLDGLLGEAYSANIIPMPLRNVYGVSYLYDFMSTSNEPMQAAILSYNMEEVKGRLNNIISGQSEIIMQQYIQNDHLIALQKQNRHLMAQLDSIDQSSQENAYYSKITAANTSAIAYFQTVDWLKN